MATPKWNRFHSGIVGGNIAIWQTTNGVGPTIGGNCLLACELKKKTPARPDHQLEEIVRYESALSNTAP